TEAESATVDTRARLDAHMKDTRTSIRAPASRLEIKLMHSAHSDWWAIDRCPFSPRGAESPTKLDPRCHGSLQVSALHSIQQTNLRLRASLNRHFQDSQS
ncbi:hypothetical protein PGTUg99_003234, partial [Puccinia graminis f. sp. tritici]